MTTGYINEPTKGLPRRGSVVITDLRFKEGNLKKYRADREIFGAHRARIWGNRPMFFATRKEAEECITKFLNFEE